VARLQILQLYVLPVTPMAMGCLQCRKAGLRMDRTRQQSQIKCEQAYFPDYSTWCLGLTLFLRD